MDQIYANEFTVTTTEREVFLKFGTSVPEYHDDKYIGKKTYKEVMIVMPPEGLETLINVLKKQLEAAIGK